jgi:flagellar motor switch protein FliM
VENPLSQADIDALMKALTVSNSDDLFGSKGDQVRSYDFKRPTKFSKDLLRTLAMIHDNFARLLQNFFLASLRTRAQVHVQSTNQYAYSEFTQLLPNPAVVATVALEPLPGTCLIEVSQNIAYAIVDRVFGGICSEIQPQRGLSEIELAVIQRTMSDLFYPLEEAWRQVAELKPATVGMETNPIFLQTSAPSEVLAVVTLGVQIGEHMGHMAIALPYSMVQPVIARLSPGAWLVQDRVVSEEESGPLRHSLQEAAVPIRVGLGTARITVGEFAALNVGDVIPLDTSTDSELPVFIGNSLNFLGRPGVVGQQMSIQIRRRLPSQAL